MVKTYKGQQYGWASIDGIQTESRLLNLENRGRESIVSLLPDNLAEETLAVLESSSDHRWTTGQRSALVGILSCKNRIQGLQGFAGTAKTTTVLKALAELASENGFVVRGIAPTHSAAQQLATGASLLSEALTVKAHLLAERYLSSDPNRAAEFWIVDEASLVSARETVMLLKAAERACARVLLVGDVQQLGSIEAGEAFRQLQESGMVTHVLEQIVRQRNNNAKNAVYQSIEGDLAGAMNSIRRSGQVAEIPDKNERVAQMALDYLNLSRSERERTIVIEPSRAGRDELNRLIRDGLREEGTLKGPQLVAESLEKVDFSSVFAKDASRYTEDDFLIFSKDLRRVGIKKGRYYQIENIDFEKKMLSLRDDNGGKVQWLPAQAGSGRVEVYRSAPFNLCVGDSIAWTRNDRLKGLKNGQLMTVIAKAGGHIKVAEPSGKEHLIDINRREGQHLRHSYCVTVHASQGLTSDRVIAQLSYKNHNLVSQRAFYVSVSRAREEIRIYTDNASALVQHLDNTSGMQQTALESGLARDGFGMHDTDAYCLG